VIKHTSIALFLSLALTLPCFLTSCSGSAAAARAADADSTSRRAGRVTSIPGYSEYYRLMRFNGLDQIDFCYPTSDPVGEPLAFAVARDLNGRPTTITRFFFGNPENRAEWTTMRIEYTYYPSTAMLVERRTYHDPSGAPMEAFGAYGEEVLYKGGQLTMRRAIDANGKPIINVRMVVRSLFKEERPGTIVQEWFFGNGKQYFGIGTDKPGEPFADMPGDAYFRRYTVDTRGEVVREEVWGLEKRAIPYPGGELVRAYEVNECGQTTSVVYLDEEGNERPNSDGIERETMRYDDAGRIAEWQAFGITGVPKGRSVDSAAAMIFHYREFDGVLVGVDRFDEKGNPIATPAEERR
jgi:hypothetical protein